MKKQLLLIAALFSLASQAVSLPSNNLRDYHLVYTSDVILDENFDSISWGQDFPSGWSSIESNQGFFEKGSVGVEQGDWSNSNNFGGEGYSFEISSSSASTGTNMAITPYLENLGTGSEIEFYAKKSEGEPKLIVGVMSNASDESTFRAIETIELTDNYSRVKVELPSGIEGKYVALKLEYTKVNETAYFDNITITEKTLGIKVYNLD